MYLARGFINPGFQLGPVDPESHGKTILTITGVFTGFAIAVVLARLYVRAFMLKTMGIDDYFMIVAMVCSATVFAFFVEEVKLGVGEHFGNPHQFSNFSSILHWGYFHGIVLVTGISSVKVSVGFFLLRLVQGKWYKRVIILWIVFLFIFTLACVGTLVFQCLPVSIAWDPVARMSDSPKCYSTATFRAIGLFNGATNIFTDFAFATLPIPIILRLQINLRTKISLVCILSLGYFACAAAIVKEVLLSSFFANTDNLFNDAFQVWNDVEINTGILAACLPTLRPLLAFLLETATAIRSGPRGYGYSGSGAQGRYYVHSDVRLGAVPSRSTLGKQGYGVTVSGGPLGDSKRELHSQPSSRSSGPMSKLEASIGMNDTGSEESILSSPIHTRVHLPSQRDRSGEGIMRTTEVMVSR